MKNRIILGLFLCTLVIGCKDDDLNMDRIYVTHVKENVYEGYQLVWSEDFLGEGLPSASSWTAEEGYQRNSELQDYLNDVSAVKLDSGKLVLRAFADPHDGTNAYTGETYHFDYSSGSVITRDKVSFERGRIDISAKIPVGRGLWPSIRLLPATDEFPGEYAAIDLMEYVWGDDAAHSTVKSAFHTSQTESGALETLPEASTAMDALDEQYHLYSLVWTKRQMDILIDDNVVVSYAKEDMDAGADVWPFDQPFYLAISLAVGGTEGGNWGVDTSVFPAEMKIDYVNYYQLAGDEPDEEEEEEIFVPVEVVKNGSFEGAFDAGKEPGILNNPGATRNSIVSQVNHWFAKGPVGNNTTLEIVSEEEGKSLRYHTDNIKDRWQAFVRYPIQNVSAGKYRLSFYAKSNRTDNSPFYAYIAFFSTEEDVEFVNSQQNPDVANCIYIDDKGTESLIVKDKDAPASQINFMYPVLSGEAGTEWTLYSVDVEIPENVLIILGVYIHQTWDYAGKTFKNKDTAPLDFYLDDVSLKTVDPSEE
ncbi:MAG: glycoside hydrolase family 16 protein [Candidatus Phocaeicola excrementipullorum]|uniref:Glycoside hydrolase family 16 protein n=1 Tax=Candidatus Phocaeicola excrementipullorum TaxID=2838731 RepID=A0A948TNZ3_9BACT|nr:glycoside hydrolase family 16 protein [Candidatus Phocaeicola excrementipullorum]